MSRSITPHSSAAVRELLDLGRPHMKTKSRSFHLSRQEQKLVDRLVAAFNSIDKHLRQMTQLDRATPFPQVVNQSLKRCIVAREDSELLRTLSSLRNVLVHEKVSQHHPVVPTTPFVEAVEQLRHRIRRPLLVIPTFRKSVETLPIIEPLATVLRIIDQRDYSQFPVYDGRVFKGLLTENGITRWLAHHVSREMSLVELNEV